MIFNNFLKNNDRNINKLYTISFFRELSLLSPIILLFYIENGLNIKELFLFQSIFYLTSILLELPLGYLTDRISKKTALLISYIFFFIPLTIWFFFTGYFAILIGEICFAISKVLFDNSKSGYLYDYLIDENKISEMPNKYAKLNFFLAFGTTIAAIIGTFLYSHFGSKFVIAILLMISIFCISLIYSLVPRQIRKTQNQNVLNLKNRISNLFQFIKETKNNKNIMYYIYYSGFLTAFSIVFALSFQPLLLKTAAPIFLFGIVGFLNHGIRAIFSALTCKILNFFEIKSMPKPLFILYILSFLFIFIILFAKNTYITIFLILLICFVIGIQLMFTIRHISRLHSFVSSSKRGALISINNLFSRSLTFIILFLSKYFIDSIGFEKYYIILLCLFFIIGIILLFKLNSVERE